MHLAASDRDSMCTELQNNCHPLPPSSNHLYNTMTGQVAAADINKHQADELGTTVQNDFIVSHPGGIRKSISFKGKTMQSMVNDLPVYDVDAFFARELIVCQKRDNLFQSPSPAPLINDGCLSKSNKSIVTHKLGSIIFLPFDTHILIIDGNQFHDQVV